MNNTKKRKKITDYDATSTTPYIRLDCVEYRKFTKYQRAEEVIIPDTGEIASLVYSGKTAYGYKDSNSYSKLFKSGTLELAKLSTAGIKVFCYILLNISPNKEFMYICIDDVTKQMGYANKKNVYEGIENLLEHNVISRKTGLSTYWINPNMVFNGDRIKLLEEPGREEYVSELKKEAKEVVQEYQLK